MRSTFMLINSYFWKTFYGPIMSFIFPVILLAILGNIFKVEYVYPGIIAMAFLFIGILSLPLTIMELKQSSLFKYIGSSPVNPLKFTLVVIGFYIFVSILSSFIIFFTTMIVFRHDVFPSDGFKNGILGGIFTSVVGSISFYTSSGIHLLFVIVAGLLIATFSKTPQQALTVGLVVLIPSIFLSGMIISVDIIAQSKVLNWISRLVPFRYSTGNMVISSTPLEQIGDMFQRLSVDQKKIIFGNESVLADGTVNLMIGGRNPMEGPVQIRSIEDLARAQAQFGDNMKAGIFQQKLFDLTLGSSLDKQAQNSDNNIFNWVNDWSVRRLPDVGPLKDFIAEYFSQYASDGEGASLEQLQPIADQIIEGKLGWLDIFMKQTNTLYFKADRVLNMLLPLSCTAGMMWYISTNFSWSVR